MSHISDTPIFSSTYMSLHTYMSLQGFVLVRGGFCSGVCLGVFCLEGFVRGGFCPSTLLSEYIHYNRKLNITFNFRFHMYEIFLKSVTSHALGPPPLSQTVTFSDPLPSSVAYFMDGPLRRSPRPPAGRGFDRAFGARNYMKPLLRQSEPPMVEILPTGPVLPVMF